LRSSGLLLRFGPSLRPDFARPDYAVRLNLSSRPATPPRNRPAAASSFDQVIDRAVEREHFFMAQMKQLHPLVETYLQNLKEDKELDAPVPTSDVYFLGRWI
jgi:hypothetical protein